MHHGSNRRLCIQSAIVFQVSSRASLVSLGLTAFSPPESVAAYAMSIIVSADRHESATEQLYRLIDADWRIIDFAQKGASCFVLLQMTVSPPLYTCTACEG